MQAKTNEANSAFTSFAYAAAMNANTTTPSVNHAGCGRPLVFNTL